MSVCEAIEAAKARLLYLPHSSKRHQGDAPGGAVAPSTTLKSVGDCWSTRPSSSGAWAGSAIPNAAPCASMRLLYAGMHIPGMRRIAPDSRPCSLYMKWSLGIWQNIINQNYNLI